MMAIEQQLSPVNGSLEPKPCEHLLDLLDGAALGQAGFFFLDNGINEEPLKLTYAELSKKAKASMINQVHTSRTAVNNLFSNMALSYASLALCNRARSLLRISIHTLTMSSGSGLSLLLAELLLS